MRPHKFFQSYEDAKKILGDDFGGMMSDLLPFLGPKIDMCRDEYGVLIVAEIPGLNSQEELSLSLHGLCLEIEGTMVRHYIKTEEQLLLSERTNGRFKRTVELPPDCALEAIQADYHNGLLYVRLPLDRAKTTKTKEKVPIQFHT